MTPLLPSGSLGTDWMLLYPLMNKMLLYGRTVDFFVLAASVTELETSSCIVGTYEFFAPWAKMSVIFLRSSGRNCWCSRTSLGAVVLLNIVVPLWGWCFWWMECLWLVASTVIAGRWKKKSLPVGAASRAVDSSNVMGILDERFLLEWWQKL